MPEIKLQTNDGKCFSVDVEIAKCSKTIKRMLDDLGMGELDEAIPLPNVDSTTLEKILQWANEHKNDASFSKDDDEKATENVDTDIIEWDRQFLTPMNCDTLMALVIAVNYLEINPLLDTCCKHFAILFKGKTVEEIRGSLKITPPHEKEQSSADACIMDADVGTTKKEIETN